MAHLWIHDDSGWNASRLIAPLFDLGSLRALTETNATIDDYQPACATSAGFARLVQVDAAGVGIWALVASPSFPVRLNGRVPAAGLRVLVDQDEIRVGGSARYFFSTETLASVEPFPGAERAVFCGRCRQQIGTGASAVRCPGCGVWYDESQETPCWSYSPNCAFCETRTALDSGFKWTPEE